MQLGGSRFFDCYIPALGCDVRIHTGGLLLVSCAQALGARVLHAQEDGGVEVLGVGGNLSRVMALNPAQCPPFPPAQMRCCVAVPPRWTHAGNPRTSEPVGAGLVVPCAMIGL